MKPYLHTVHTRDVQSILGILRIMPETVAALCQLTDLMADHLILYLNWYMPNTGNWISSNNSNLAPKITASYK